MDKYNNLNVAAPSSDMNRVEKAHRSSIINGVFFDWLVMLQNAKIINLLYIPLS